MLAGAERIESATAFGAAGLLWTALGISMVVNTGPSHLANLAVLRSLGGIVLASAIIGWYRGRGRAQAFLNPRPRVRTGKGTMMDEPTTHVGRVHQLNRKSQVPGQRGLPKVAVAEARFTAVGVEGDYNVFRHDVADDDPSMAVLIMPMETLTDFNREGWPVRLGDLGENVTSTGIPYDEFVPGRRFRLGAVLVEVTKPCTPCDNLFLLPYVGERRGPEFLKVTLDRRGWYAKVLEEGLVRTGDPITPDRRTRTG